MVVAGCVGGGSAGRWKSREFFGRCVLMTSLTWSPSSHGTARQGRVRALVSFRRGRTPGRPVWGLLGRPVAVVSLVIVPW